METRANNDEAEDDVGDNGAAAAADDVKEGEKGERKEEQTGMPQN